MSDVFGCDFRIGLDPVRTTEKGSIMHLLHTSTSRVGKLQDPGATPSEGLFDLFAILGLVTIKRLPWTHSQHV